jgi:hypothetical protein
VPGRHRRRPAASWFTPVAVVVSCLLVLTAVYFRTRIESGRPVAHGLVAQEPVGSASSTGSGPPIPGVGPTSVAPSNPAAPSRPVRLTIASIGVRSSLQSLQLLPNGAMQPPTEWSVAGWYAGGIVPGQIGPAVIAGHIDSTYGPAVFYRLRELARGAKILVTDQDGAQLTFVVDGHQTFPKRTFPINSVYAPTPDAELKLITCTGDFDRATHNYLSNLIVSAHLVSGSSTPTEKGPVL